MESFDTSWDEVVNIEEKNYQSGFDDGKRLDCVRYISICIYICVLVCLYLFLSTNT